MDRNQQSTPGYTANGHVINPGEDQQQKTTTTADNNTTYDSIEEDQVNHETLPYNWDSPTDRTKAVGFRQLFRQNWHPTIVYCGVFWSFGMCVAFLGPTLLDLGCQTTSDMKKISWVFFFQLCCTLIGSILAGYLAQRANANYIILVSTALIPLSMFIIPFCQILGTLAVVLCVMGLNMGIIDCLANLKMIQLYGEDVPPFLQAMHFCYGLGAFVSPLIAEPFLLNEDCSTFIDHDVISNVSKTDSGSPIIDTILPHQNKSMPAGTLEEAQNMTGVRYAFWIMCTLQVPIPFLVASLLYKEKSFTWRLTKPDSLDVKATSNGVSQKQRKIPGVYGSITKSNKVVEPFWQQEQYRHFNNYKCCGNSTVQVITITMSTAVALFIFDGLQSAYGGYIYSYAVKSIVDLSRTEGAYLNALYWGMFAVGRLLSIPLALVCSSAFMMFGNIVITALDVVQLTISLPEFRYPKQQRAVMLTRTHQQIQIGCLGSTIVMISLRHVDAALFAGTAFFGLFLSSSTPTALSLAEQYIDITPSITTFVVVIAACGDMIAPVVVGNIFVMWGPISFLEFMLILSIFSVFSYLVTLIVGTQTPKHKAKGVSSFFWCRMCCVRPPDTMSEDGVTTHVKYYTRMSESDSNVELSNMPNAQQ